MGLEQKAAPNPVGDQSSEGGDEGEKPKKKATKEPANA